MNMCGRGDKDLSQPRIQEILTSMREAAGRG